MGSATPSIGSMATDPERSHRGTDIRRGTAVVGNAVSYRAEPAAGVSVGAVVVLPELFGLSPHVTAVCDTLASHGYRALAPDPYHRTPGASVLPEDADGRDRGFQLLAALTEADVVGDVERAIRAATDEGVGLAGVVGLSVGGYLGFLAAMELPVPAAVLLYPGWLDSSHPPIQSTTPALARLPNARGRILVLVGEDDHVLDRSAQRGIRAAFAAADRDHAVVAYPGVGHGYLAPGRPAYDESAAADSWRRIVAHLH